MNHKKHQLMLITAFQKGQEDHQQGIWRPEMVIHCSECRSEYAAGWAWQLNYNKLDMHVGEMIWRIP